MAGAVKVVGSDQRPPFLARTAYVAPWDQEWEVKLPCRGRADQ